MKTVKYIRNDGFDICESKMLKKLSDCAKEGWILEKLSAFAFKLVKKEPQNLIYAVDYQPNVLDREEYVSIFRSAGWNFVCETAGFYIYSAPEGTTPIYTEKCVLKEQVDKRFRGVLFTMIISFLIMVTTFTIKNDVLFFTAGILSAGVWGLCFTWMIGLAFKRKKLA